MASLEGIVLHSHGSRLLGTLFRPDTRGQYPTALLLHGIPGLEKNYDLAYALRDAGWNAFLVHYRGSWGSQGEYSLPGLLDDIAAAVDFLSRHDGVDQARLAGVGFSLGGWAVVTAAAHDPRLRAVVALNPLVDPSRARLGDPLAADFAAMLHGITAAKIQAQWELLPPLPRVAPQLAGRPVLLLTGDADSLFPPEHAGLLAEALPHGLQAWQRLPEANHTFDQHRQQMVRRVLDWLQFTFFPPPPLPAGLSLRPPREADHARILQVMVDWWDGRDIRGLLPRLFLQHFNDTSFIVEQAEELAGFLIGFISQSEPGVAYIHFVGVGPRWRRAGLGRALYERFFRLARARGAREVRCITAVVNTGSQAFHTRLGFSVSEPQPGYDGPQADRITFRKTLA